MSTIEAFDWLGVGRTASAIEALGLWKSKMVEAARRGDEDKCKLLSQVKERLKKHFGQRCLVCGVRLNSSKVSSHCGMHHVQTRYYRKRLHQ